MKNNWIQICRQAVTYYVDRFDQPVFLFENQFALNWFKDKHPEVELKALF